MPDLAQIRDSSVIIVIPTSRGPSLTREQNVEASTTSMSKTSDGEGLQNFSSWAVVEWLRSTRRRLETETGDAEDVRESSDLTERGVPEVGTEPKLRVLFDQSIEGFRCRSKSGPRAKW